MKRRRILWFGQALCLMGMLAAGPQCRKAERKDVALADAVLLPTEKDSTPSRPKPKPILPNEGVALRTKGLEFQLPVMSLFALPGQTLRIEGALAPALATLSARAAKGRLVLEETGVWTYIVPKRPGVETITFEQGGTGNKTTLRVFSLVPASRLKKGKIGNYEIGLYSIGNTNPIYAPPTGYIEVTPDMAELTITPNIRLIQLTSKQSTTFPKYLVVNEKLLIKLEMVLRELRSHRIKAGAWKFVSGYRTPYYNTSIENVSLSRHQYGDAADVFIDEDADGYMDDLNHDGKVDLEDARQIGQIVDSMDNSAAYEHLSGGMGLYRPKGARTPFVHIDTRGKKARWIN